MAFLPEMYFLAVSRSAKFDQVFFGDGDEMQILQSVEKAIDAKDFSFYAVIEKIHGFLGPYIPYYGLFSSFWVSPGVRLSQTEKSSLVQIEQVSPKQAGKEHNGCPLGEQV